MCNIHACNNCFNFIFQEKADLEAKNTRKLYTDVFNTENTFVKVSHWRKPGVEYLLINLSF